jgi:hypothetical protein
MDLASAMLSFTPGRSRAPFAAALRCLAGATLRTSNRPPFNPALVLHGSV